ncbi:MAG: response regulator [Bryobacteraceae bacterium]|nr:response regulator [Bryobacteraceae bacterium]
MKIFLAEDNPADVYLLREALGVENDSEIELVVAHDGEEAMDFVHRRGKFGSLAKPDLIVLDLNLPKSDGSDILRCIRESTELREIPVVVLTSSDSPRDRAAAARLGADGYITKPSDLDAFLSLGLTLRAFATTSDEVPPDVRSAKV